MAKEAELVFRTENPVNFEVADAASIPKGTVLKAADGMEASAATGDEDIVAGIAAAEKIANDGVTKIPVFRRGIFRMHLRTSTTAGQSVSTYADAGDTNDLVPATSTATGAKILGIALENKDDAVGLVELNVGANNNAYA